MEPGPLLIAGLAAAGVLLIVLGLSGNSPVDPVQARLTQLGSMQAKNLEELELQQPFAERTLRPLMARFSGRMQRMTSTSFSDTTERRLALAGNPGDMRVADWLGIKAVSAIVGAAIFFFLFYVINILGLPLVVSLLMIPAGALFGYIAPEFWLGRKVRARQHAILLMIPDALDLLTISVRAGLGFDAALGKVVEKLQGPLSDEFRRALAEVRVGKARREALTASRASHHRARASARRRRGPSRPAVTRKPAHPRRGTLCVRPAGRIPRSTGRCAPPCDCACAAWPCPQPCRPCGR